MLSSVCSALPEGYGYGWGVCGSEINKRLASLLGTSQLPPDNGYPQLVANVCLQAINGPDWGFSTNYRGDYNVGYGFIEHWGIARKYKYNATHNWNFVISGSSYMNEMFNEMMGFAAAMRVIQGVDTDKFRYDPDIVPDDDFFCIGSYGKLEFRKAQDVVAKAVAIFSKSHKNVRLIHAWENKWPTLVDEFAAYSDIGVTACKVLTGGESMSDYSGGKWGQYVSGFLRRAGCSGIDHMPINGDLSSIYGRCDVALFPNRLEAGTNLCLHENLASGVPCIALDAHGHEDLTGHADYPCTDLTLKEYKRVADDRFGEYFEPCVDEIVSKLHYAYVKKQDLLKRRQVISEFGSRFTWDKSAKAMAEIIKYLL